MKKLVTTILLFLSMTSVANSQIFVGNDGTVTDQRKGGSTKTKSKKTNQESVHSTNKFDKSKLVFGGSFGLQFGDYTLIDVSPQVGYNFSKYLTAGAGIGYTYSKEKYYNNNTRYDLKSSYASFNLFGRLYPVQYVVLNVQPEISHMWRSMDSEISEKYSENKFVPSLILGGGFRLGGMVAMIQYDVIQDKYSPYGDNVFYTVGYTFGF